MLSLADFKKSLGDFGANLTEEQVKNLFDLEIRIADIFIERYNQKQIQKC